MTPLSNFILEFPDTEMHIDRFDYLQKNLTFIYKVLQPLVDPVQCHPLTCSVNGFPAGA